MADVRPIEILLVEDNPGDVLLTKEAFSEARILNNIHVAKDGEEALMYLYDQLDGQQSIKPDIILLDLNLPKIDGHEVLEKVKNDKALKHIPVVILTSSKAEKDILQSYNAHANSYIVKPVDLDQLTNVVRAIERFWFSVVTFAGR